MARKFVDLEEAAKMLGVSPDTLNEMRERKKIYGYRDGSSWKFKGEDVERLIAERDEADQEGDYAELDEDPDSILLSEVELGGGDDSTSSTIIGGRTSKDSPESDIQIARPASESDLNLDSALSSGPGGSDVLSAGSGVSPMFDDLDKLDLEMPSAADSGISSGLGLSSLDLGADVGSGSAVNGGSGVGSGSAIGSGSGELTIEGSGVSRRGEDDLVLDEAPEEGAELSDSKGGGSAIDLTGDEDGDLVLGGSSHGGGMSPGDSGISLLDPADSGLSLESQPLELGGSAVEALELGEDELDLGLGGDEPEPAKPAAKGRAAQPQADDDFLLAPIEELEVEESDSGSQVIASEGDVEFGDPATSAAVSGISSGMASGISAIEEDLDFTAEGPAAGASGIAGRSAVARAAAEPAPALGMTMVAAEAPFSLWNVSSLAMCSLVLLFCGMFMFDLLRNMWSWSGPYPVNSAMMDMVLSWF